MEAKAQYLVIPQSGKQYHARDSTETRDARDRRQYLHVTDRLRVSEVMGCADADKLAVQLQSGSLRNFRSERAVRKQTRPAADQLTLQRWNTVMRHELTSEAFIFFIFCVLLS